MALSDTALAKLNQTLTPILDELDYELYDIRIRKENEQTILDIKIDKADGITIDDCAIASRKISLVLDVEDFFSFQYILQVGSPGIYRELRTEKDFNKHLNERIRVHYYTAERQNKKAIGILSTYENQQISIATDQGKMRFDLKDIKKIQLFPQI